MKLLIDITELMWERLKKHSLNYGDIEDIKDSIREGTPLDDLKEIYIGMDGNAVQIYPNNELLDKIRTEIQEELKQDNHSFYRAALEDVIKIIDKYMEGEKE